MGSSRGSPDDRRPGAADLLRRRIPELLARSRRTPAELTRHCGHKGPWLRNFIAGRQQNLFLADLEKIAAFFGITIQELFDPHYYAVYKPEWKDRRSGRDRRQRGERRKHWPPLKPTD